MNLPKKPLNYELIYAIDHIEQVSADEFACIIYDKLKEQEKIIPFTVDSRDYFILEDAANMISNVRGLICEIGIRNAGGMRFIMESLIKADKERICIGIDPYGAIPYEGTDGKVLEDGPYDNKMMKKTLKLMYEYLLDYPKIDFLLFPLEDSEFFKRYANGIPIYNKTKSIINEYALVHFDGPHHTDHVLNETKFFHERTPRNAMFVYDDVEYYYDHKKVENYLFCNGWELVNKTKVKASYIKSFNNLGKSS